MTPSKTKAARQFRSQGQTLNETAQILSVSVSSLTRALSQNEFPYELKQGRTAHERIWTAMTEGRRAAPHPEWVEMYRRGIPASTIAATHPAAVTAVRYHLQIAAKVDPGLRTEHRAALVPVVRVPAPSLRNL